MNHWILQLMGTYGYVGIAFLIMLENIFPPLPSEAILTFAGFLTTYTTLHIPGAVLSATLGSLLGAICLYALGKLLSPLRMETLLSGPVGKTLHLKKEDMQKAMDWFDSRGNYTVFLCRFIPIVRSLISIPAGMANMNIPRFLWLTLWGSLLWNTILISLGAFAGASWQKAARYFGNYTRAAKMVLLIFLFTGLLLFFYRRWGKKSSG